MKCLINILKNSVLFVTAIAVFFTSCETKKEGIQEEEKPLSLAEIEAIAEEGFIYGLPIVTNYAIMYAFAVDSESEQFKAPFNQIKNEERLYTHKDTVVTNPNSDTLYSILWLDLRTEPMVLSVPAVEKKRYYSIMLCDGNTFNYGYIGSRATGNEAGDYMVVGPDWKGETPVGIKKVFRSGTLFSLAGYRTQLFNLEDLPNAIEVQSGYKAQPLSAYLNQIPGPQATPINFPKITKEMIKDHFFEYLDFALQFAPPGPEEVEIRSKLAQIGVGPGKTFNFANITPEQKAALELGINAGGAKIAAAVSSKGKKINGWRVGSLAAGDRTFFNGDWLSRAAIAKAGIYANSPIEAVYPIARHDSRGEALDASLHKYTLTFLPEQFPPVHAFWSVTVYDRSTQMLTENTINRYSINSSMIPEMKTNPDGSLTLYIQHESPVEENTSNWLPAPNGPIYLVMRLYWPKETKPSILPPGAGTWDPPGVVATD